MTKEEALQAIKLLSAMESWAFSLKERMPEYLHEDLYLTMQVLEKIVLKKDSDCGLLTTINRENA